MSQQYKANFFTQRFYLTVCVIIIIALGLAWRAFQLTIIEQHFLQRQGDERVLRLVNAPGFRGMMTDRNGFPLAVSTTVYSVWTNPQEFDPQQKELRSLSKLIGLKPNEIINLVDAYKKKHREFVYLKRALSPEIIKHIKQLDIPGLYLQEEYRRYYPEGEITAHVTGFTNIDDRGQEGMELGYNEWLAGEPGKKWVMKDRLGRVIVDLQTMKEQKAGHDLVLSIDRRIQYLAYRELLAGLIANRASSASAVVLDVKTGEVLAMVNQPSFNPNNRPMRVTQNFRNRAVTDTFEPGSTIKAFTVASALESGVYKPDSVIDTSPGWIKLDDNIVKDEKDNGKLSMTQILQKSSNTGTAKIVLNLPPDQLWSLLHRVGFGEITGIEFPGEQSGALRHYWGSFTLATLSFGYGISVTTLQLARAYAVIANKGIKLPVSLLRQDKPAQGERVLDEKVAGQMLSLLEAVVMQDGTGKTARVPGFRVAGKTGTSWIAGAKGYQKHHHYTSSFVGIAPVNDPRFVVAIVVHDPQGKDYLGGPVAGPIFEKIMEGTLRILDVAPEAQGASIENA